LVCHNIFHGHTRIGIAVIGFVAVGGAAYGIDSFLQSTGVIGS